MRRKRMDAPEEGETPPPGGRRGSDEDEDLEAVAGEEPVVELPVEDSIDLHFFHPRDVKAVVEEYLAQCRARGWAEVRIIHGRGSGAQRAIVRSLLERSPDVLAFRDAEGERGGWGATVVRLKEPRSDDPRSEEPRSEDARSEPG